MADAALLDALNDYIEAAIQARVDEISDRIDYEARRYVDFFHEFH
jgi:hypothetical protein